MVAQSDLAAVPYLGLYSKYLLAIEVSMQTFTEKGGFVVNFTKMRALFAQQREMMLFQRQPYRFARNELLFQELMGQLHTLSEDALYERSLAIEPRSAT